MIRVYSAPTLPLVANLTTDNRPPPIDESRGDAG